MTAAASILESVRSLAPLVRARDPGYSTTGNFIRPCAITHVRFGTRDGGTTR